MKSISVKHVGKNDGDCALIALSIALDVNYERVRTWAFERNLFHPVVKTRRAKVPFVGTKVHEFMPLRWQGCKVKDMGVNIDDLGISFTAIPVNFVEGRPDNKVKLFKSHLYSIRLETLVSFDGTVSMFNKDKRFKDGTWIIDTKKHWLTQKNGIVYDFGGPPQWRARVWQAWKIEDVCKRPDLPGCGKIY